MFKTSVDGKDQILNIVRPGETFNDAPVLNGGPNQASAQAIVATGLYELRKSEIGAILKNHPQIAMNAIKVLASQANQLVSLVEDLSFKHVIGRVAKILLKHAADSSNPGLRLTQQEMAALAGSAREVVGRSLKSLEEPVHIHVNLAFFRVFVLKADGVIAEGLDEVAARNDADQLVLRIHNKHGIYLLVF